MPQATVTQETVHKELKSCPGGYVELKQLSFDQMLERRDKAMRMSMEQAGRGRREQNAKIDLETASKWTRQFEFSHCIVDHNLEDDKGQKLNFANPMTLSVLDPKIGAEIERYIEELNQEDEESLEDFTERQSGSSEVNGKKPSSNTDTT